MSVGLVDENIQSIDRGRRRRRRCRGLGTEQQEQQQELEQLGMSSFSFGSSTICVSPAPTATFLGATTSFSAIASTGKKTNDFFNFLRVDGRRHVWWGGKNRG